MSDVIIYTDGACSYNPGPGGYGALLLQAGKVRELGGFAESTTNNRMEMQALVEAFKEVSGEKSLIRVYTDSSYLIQGLESWIFNWKRRGWKTASQDEVLNKDLWQELDRLRSDLKIKFIYVPGHSGFEGNERCDQIAVAFSKKEPISLYQGSLEQYAFKKSFMQEELKKIEAYKKPKKKKSSSSGKKAYSYLSRVGGVVQIHPNWAECEKRVKGAKGALFKKVFSAEEEKELFRKWSS